MADISKCAGAGCDRKEICYRFTALESFRQAWADFPNKGDKCNNYIDNQLKRDK